MSKTPSVLPVVKNQQSLTDQIAEQRRKVDFDTFDISVQQLVSMIEAGQIDIAPEFQRQYRWDSTRQSQLIESIFLGIPVPSLFMATNPDGTWDVVDGVQRLSTIVHFSGSDTARKSIGIKSMLRVENLKKLTSLNGETFVSLPKSTQTQFLLRPIKVITLSDKSDLKVRFDLFERLNTGGIALTNQEIRACIFGGPFNNFLEEMAKNRSFRRVVLLPKPREHDRTREECVLRFFAFLYNYKNFEHSVVDFLHDYMKASTESFNYNLNRRRFEETFDALKKILPKGIVRTRTTTPVNLFEAVAVGAAIALEKRKKLKVVDSMSWIQSEELEELTTGATNDRSRVTGRIEFCAKKFGA